MALEPRLTAPAAQMKLQQLRQQIDAALDALVADMLALAAEDRDAAASEARTDAERQAEAALAERVAIAQSEAVEAARESALSIMQNRVAEAEAEAARAQAAADDRIAQALARARAESDDRIAQAVAQERAQSDDRIAQAVAAERAEAEQRVAQAVAAERTQAELRFADAQAQAATQVTETRAEERQCDLACLERLVDAMRELDAAASLSQVLDRVCEHAAGQVARAAVFVLRDEELRGWRTSGFGQLPDPTAVTVPLDAPTVVGRAARTGAKATNDEAGDGPLEPLPFAALPKDRISLALPLNVGARTVAVLYADEGEGEPTVPSAWPETLEILARHAASRLELLTMARAYGLHAQQPGNGLAAPSPLVNRPATTSEAPPLTPPPGARPPSLATDAPVSAGNPAADEDASALRYARLLVSEIKLYHEDDVNQGRRDANLLARLGPEIARARRLYEERVPAEVRSRADHFGQELVRTLANGDQRLLGQAT